MKIGIPKEIKDLEFRVVLLPSGVARCVAAGHEVIVEAGAGTGIGVDDSDYRDAGASIAESAGYVFTEAEMIVKVKEPQLEERKSRLREGQILFSYLHLAPDQKATQDLLDRKIIGLGFETVTDKSRQTTPLLAPMSQIAGRLAAMVGSRLLEKAPTSVVGGTRRKGKLVMGVPGVDSARYVIIGGGVVGENAIEYAIGLGAQVTVFDQNPARLTVLAQRFPSLTTLFPDKDTLQSSLARCDVAIGAIHLRGSQSGHIVSRDMVAGMQSQSVIVDVCIDQGGCFETSRPTSHSNPTYTEEDVIHYCVSNMPGIVPLTASQSLNHVITPYVLAIADHGIEGALRNNPGLAEGLNVYHGLLTNGPVAKAQGRSWQTPLSVFSKITE